MPRKTTKDLLDAVQMAKDATTPSEIRTACSEIKACLMGGVDPFPIVEGKVHPGFIFNVLQDCPKQVIKECLDFAKSKGKYIDFSYHPKTATGSSRLNLLQIVAVFNPEALEEVMAYVDFVAAKNPGNPNFKTSQELLDEPIYITSRIQISLLEYMATSVSTRGIVHIGKFKSKEDEAFVIKWAGNSSEDSLEKPATYAKDGYIEVELDCNADAIAYLEKLGLVSIAYVKTYKEDKTAAPLYFPHWVKITDLNANSENQEFWIEFVKNFMISFSRVKIVEVLKNGLIVEAENYADKDPIRFKITFNRAKLLKLCNTANEAAIAREEEEKAKRETEEAQSSGSGSTPTRRDSSHERLKARVSDLGHKHDALKEAHVELRSEFEELASTIDKRFIEKLSSKSQLAYAELRNAFREILETSTSREACVEFFKDKRIDLVARTGLAVVSTLPHAALAATVGTEVLHHWQATRGLAKRDEGEHIILSANPTESAPQIMAMVLAYNFVVTHQDVIEGSNAKQAKALKDNAIAHMRTGVQELAKSEAKGRAVRGTRDKSDPIRFLHDHVEEGLSTKSRKAWGIWSS